MKNPLKYAFLSLLVVLGFSVAANADPDKKWDPPKTHRDDRTAPEVDPSLAVAGFSLLAGSVAVLRARSRK
jgi:hypothetical protein